MANRKDIGVAIVGLGIGEQHAKAYLKTGQCILKWLYDCDAQKSRAVCDHLGNGSVAESFEKILEDPNVDVVSIASYDDAHYIQVLAALQAGKHVFAEKPLCRSLEELKEIKKVWAKNNGALKLYSNLILRTAPAYQWLKEKIKEGFFGDIFSFDGDYLYGRLHKITEGWRKNVKGYSVMFGGGIHLVDLLLWFLEERPQFVYAHGNRIASKNTEFQYHDFMSASLQFGSGLIGRITANFGCVHKHQHVLRIFGTKGTFFSDDIGPRWTRSRDPETKGHCLSQATLPHSKGDLIPQFLDAIIQDKDLNDDTQSIFDAISVCAATDQSLDTDQKIAIQYV